MTTKKVRVTLVVEVDVDGWAAENYVPPNLVPDDVKHYVLSNVQGWGPVEDGLWLSVSLAPTKKSSDRSVTPKETAE